jgi:hypothetical protein
VFEFAEAFENRRVQILRFYWISDFSEQQMRAFENWPEPISLVFIPAKYLPMNKSLLKSRQHSARHF